MKTTVIHHSADFDGLFCREIARKFLPDAELIGWDFGDAPLDLKGTEVTDRIIVMDLPLDAPFGLKMSTSAGDNQASGFPDTLVWIDHHASSIASHPKNIHGYRIDGVAACRLAWQWFRMECHDYPLNAGRGGQNQLPTKEEYIGRKVPEPLAVRLAGEYDIWDKRDPRAELFQHGLRSCNQIESLWDLLLSGPTPEADGKQGAAEIAVGALLENGSVLQFAREQEYRDVITQQGFDIEFEGLTFLACNSHELDIRSQLFEAGIKPHHDGLFGFTFTGNDWRVSLYGVPGKPDIDLSPIAVKYGGGGHRQACGFRCQQLPNSIIP